MIIQIAIGSLNLDESRNSDSMYKCGANNYFSFKVYRYVEYNDSQL